MDLIGRFQEYLQKTVQIQPTDKILLAVSGGRDSMLMAHLFLKAGYRCCIAHCNFGLRGDASDADEHLVRTFAKDTNTPIVVRRFDTESFARKEGISIQMAARTLRYAWFEEQRSANDAQWVAIAQHRNDHVETVLLNLTRGTGLQGLQGILPKRDLIIRPLLFLWSKEVTHYVRELQIPFRDDQSNFSTKYARNKIRLEIVPKFREIAVDFEEIMLENITHFQESFALLQAFIDPLAQTVFIEQHGGYRIEKKELGKYIHNLPLLYALFKPFGFSKVVLSDLQSGWAGESGKRYLSSSHELILGRAELWLFRHGWEQEGKVHAFIQEDQLRVNFYEYVFDVSIHDHARIDACVHRVQIDYDLLHFPLRLRTWEQGDVFYPLGMQGKKKVSDFFIQQKIAIHEKKRIPILVNGNGEIIWIVNHRLDNRYRITKSTKKVFTLVCK
ncbi:tRNA lysidine(34) synthetase TilS [Sphingobacterium suaedae]|uniref:tRNA(Ile)-lysidine synthase n=1 Tax=Sphingobacterium suaedae TaxID=1686402 RepID=A0ABW5KIV9_9SPHI